MKSIEKRLRRLEYVPSPQESEAGKRAREILAKLGVELFPPGTFDGCHTIADAILRARSLHQERGRSASATRTTITK